MTDENLIGSDNGYNNVKRAKPSNSKLIFLSLSNWVWEEVCKIKTYSLIMPDDKDRQDWFASRVSVSPLVYVFYPPPSSQRLFSTISHPPCTSPDRSWSLFKDSSRFHPRGRHVLRFRRGSGPHRVIIFSRRGHILKFSSRQPPLCLRGLSQVPRVSSSLRRPPTGVHLPHNGPQPPPFQRPVLPRLCNQSSLCPPSPLWRLQRAREGQRSP